jgi:hypothetical protein
MTMCVNLLSIVQIHTFLLEYILKTYNNFYVPNIIYNTLKYNKNLSFFEKG